MNNLIRTEIYKSKKNMLLRKLIIISVMFAIMCFLVQNFSDDGGFSLSTTIEGEFYGVSTTKVLNLENTTILDYFYSAMGITPWLTILIIFSATSNISKEYSERTFGGPLVHGYSRKKIYTAKCITTSIEAAIIFGCFITVWIIPTIIINGIGNISILSVLDKMATFLFLLWIVISLLTTILVVAVTFFKNDAVICGAGIALVLTAPMLMGMLPTSIHKFSPIYMIMDICGQIPTTEIIISTLLLAILEIVIIICIGLYRFCNEDIK